MYDIIDTSDATKSAISAGIIGGIIYGIVKKSKPAGIFGYAIGFGIVTLAGATIFNQLTK